MTIKCSFTKHSESAEFIYLVDDDVGMSMTNDAESVVEWAHKTHPGKRIIYRDTAGQWDEMIHDNHGRFISFQRGHDPVLTLRK